MLVRREMSFLPYALEVPNEERRQEQGVENFARMISEAAERFLESRTRKATTGR
jgi:hypothetical protein